MANKRRALVLCVLGLALTPCSRLSPSPVSVAGAWNGTLSACVNQWDCTFTFQLQQSGSVLNGSWSANNNTMVNGTIVGSAGSSAVSMTLRPSNASFCAYSINAAVSQPATMTGTFTAPTCASPAPSGTFRATRQ